MKLLCRTRHDADGRCWLLNDIGVWAGFTWKTWLQVFSEGLLSDRLMGGVHSRDSQKQYLTQRDELRLADGGHTDGRHITCEKTEISHFEWYSMKCKVPKVGISCCAPFWNADSSPFHTETLFYQAKAHHFSPFVCSHWITRLQCKAALVSIHTALQRCGSKRGMTLRSLWFFQGVFSGVHLLI